MNKGILFITLVGLFLYCGCATETKEYQGRVVIDTVDSKLLKTSINYQVYLPEAYQDTSKTFPVIYLLHGHGGDEKDWFETNEGNIAFLLDSLIQENKIPPSLAVTIDAGNSWYVNRPKPIEDFYLKEFIPFFEEQFRVDTLASRIIAGNSAGGYGALRFSLTAPQFFDHVILLSPASYEPIPPAISSSRKVAAFAKDGVFNDSIWNHFSYTHLWSNIQNNKPHLNYYLSVGDDDAYNIVPVVTRLQQRMLQDSIKNELRITNGGHDWKCWQQNFTTSILQIYQQN